MDVSGAVSNTEVSQLRMTPQAVLAPSEVVVAEQIRHWVVRDVQNAQLRLDGLGESPVHIDISVKGQVATVLFATDSLQARALIQDSLKHLDALLGQEGLVLSGSSGSTSSQQGRPQGGQADPAIEAVLGARRLQVRSQVSIESVVSPTRPGLDVYV
jgi:flagellar hook-length control protein FliK